MMEKGNEPEKLSEVVDINYIDPQEAVFAWSDGGFLSMRIGETTYSRVNLHRAFPLSRDGSYISVRDHDGKEIGMIESIADFPDDTRCVLHRELDRRYFAPEIQKIVSIREEFGYAYWDVVTDAGPRRFTVRNGHGNVVPLDERRVMICDADGNRFIIADIAKIGPREMKLVEPMLLQ